MSETADQAPPTPPHEDGFSLSEKPTEIVAASLPPHEAFVNPDSVENATSLPDENANDTPANLIDAAPAAALKAHTTVSEAERKEALRADARTRAELLQDGSADPQSHFRAYFYSLIYWDKPVKSGIALGSILLFLILSSYFNPLRFIAGLWSLSILGNLAFVHVTQQYKRITNKPIGNPHESRIKATESGLLEKSKIDQWVSSAVDGVNLAAQAAAKIVLIEDGHRSLTWAGWGFATYVLAGWISTKWILGLAAILSFSLPKLYIENKVIVDDHVAKATVIARQQADKAHALAQQHAGPYYEKATALGQQYGLVAKPKGE